MRFCPLGSGSNGNCIYAANGESGVLVDAGLPLSKILERMSEIGEDIRAVKAIFLTHEHSDHTSGISSLSKKYDIPIFATQGTWLALARTRLADGVAERNRRVISPMQERVGKDFTVLAFPIPHDANEPVGYSLFCGDKKITVVTDVGHITPEVEDSARNCDILLVESNHDTLMLKYGRYPEYLKKRVMSGTGHLSNALAGELIARSACERLRHVFLGHLSGENNRPSVALETVGEVLKSREIDTSLFRLHLASRDGRSELVEA